MVDHQLVESFVAATAAGGGLGVEATLFAQLLEDLARPERGGREVRHASRGHGLGDLRIGPKRGRALLEDQVGAHAAARKVPDPVSVLSPISAGVEMARPAVAATLQKIHQEEGALLVLRAEAQILVV